MMDIAKAALRFRPIVLSIVAMLTVWGAFTFMSMPRREDPAFTIRTCVVTTSWPGTPAVKIEELVTDKLEEVIEGIEEVDEINSTTINGLSTINVDLDDNVRVADIQNVWDKVRAQVDMVPMPDANIKPLVNDTFGDTSVLLLAIYQKGYTIPKSVPTNWAEKVKEDKRYTPRDLEDYADLLRESFRTLDGVAKVEKFGVIKEAIYVETDLATWSKTEINVDRLRKMVSERNIVATGGNINTGEGKFNIKPGGEFDRVEEIKSITGNAAEDSGLYTPVQLGDMGFTVRREYEDPRSKYCRFSDVNGSHEAVILSVTMKSGSNIIDICENCMKAYDHLVDVEQSLPGDLGVTPVSKQSDNVTMKINDVVSNVISAIVIVVIVVWLFVGLRTSIVMASNIPIVVLASIAIVSLFGVELEQISLASIIIALGLLVDNAVQVCDQTRVNITDGMTPREAAVKAGRTLMFPMLVGTATTVAAFFPMLIALEGGGKEYIYSLPVTLSTTLILSWFLAMSVCVILASAIIKPPKDPDAPTGPLLQVGGMLKNLWNWMTVKLFQRSEWKLNTDNQNKSESFFLRMYGLGALLFIRMKWIVLLATIGLVWGALSLNIGTEFFPQDRRDQFYIEVYLPETSTIEQTNEVVFNLETMIRKLSLLRDEEGNPIKDEEGNEIERLRAMRSMVGGGGSRWALAVSPPSAASNTAQLLIRTTDGAHTAGLIKDIRRVTYEGDSKLGLTPITGARIVPKSLSLGPPAEPVVIRVTGQSFADIEELRRIARDVYHLVRRDDRVWDVHDTWGIDGYEINLEIDDQKANISRVTNKNVADTLASFFDGAELTKFREDDKSIPVYFRIKEDDRSSLTSLSKAYVDSQQDTQKIPLNSVTKLLPRFQPAKIERRDLNRNIEIKAEVEDGISGNDVVKDLWNGTKNNKKVERPDGYEGPLSLEEMNKNLPPGFSIELGGSYEESQDSAEQMVNSFYISIVAIVLILIIQYNGWSKTALILSTLPLAIVGAWFGLWLTDNPIGFMPQLGLLSLFGIVLNTGVIFIEFADMLMVEKAKAGDRTGPYSGLTKQEFRECLVAAGKQRMLPIFLTTATTVGGLIPLALSGGPLWEGLAWLMIFGLCIATLMTLFVLPALYAIVVETFRVQPVGAAEGQVDSDQVDAD